MPIVITAASGHLGRLAVEALIARGVTGSEIVAAARSPEKIADLADSVRTARIDYDEPATVRDALDDGDTFVLISGNDPERRSAQHAAVIEAAVDAGAGRIVYTSCLRADASPLALAESHFATEKVLRSAGTGFTILRNGWYTENYLQYLPEARDRGVLVASVGEGRVAPATRRDLAEAIAVVATTDGHEGRVYELNGDTDLTYHDIAAAFSAVLGREVVYRPVSSDEHRSILSDAGLPEPVVEAIVGIDAGLRQGAMARVGDDLTRLLGRPTTSFVDGIRAAIEGQTTNAQ